MRSGVGLGCCSPLRRTLVLQSIDRCPYSLLSAGPALLALPLLQDARSRQEGWLELTAARGRSRRSAHCIHREQGGQGAQAMFLQGSMQPRGLMAALCCVQSV